MPGPVLYFIIIFLFLIAIVLLVHMEKLVTRIKRLKKALLRLEGKPEPLEEPPEWL